MRTSTMLILVLLLAVCASFCPEVRAERATPEEMERVCENWLAYMVHEKGEWAGSVRPEVVRYVDLLDGETPLARCYSIAPRGNVVVPFLKELPPIKAYSDECNLDADLGVGMVNLLRDVLGPQVRLFETVDDAGKNRFPDAKGTPFARDNHGRWRRLTANHEDFLARLGKSAGSKLEEGPLLTTAWHQDSPYNDDCPIGDMACTSCFGGAWNPAPPSFVGCVATATAQVMNYWQWPPRSGGVKIFLWSGDNSCVSMPNPHMIFGLYFDPYDWANMPAHCEGGCTQVQAEAVAELCYEVGLAYETDYGVCYSPAYLESSLVVLPKRFAYDPSIEMEYRSGYNDVEWWDLITEEVDAGRPMLYGMRIDSPVDGHALVCDGYTDDPDSLAGYQYGVHLNFGWGRGPWIGWFALDSPSPPNQGPPEWPGTAPSQEVLVRRIMPATLPIVIQIADNGPMTIQEAIDAAGYYGYVVELADGLYTGPGNRDISFLGKAVTVRSASGNPEDCIIDCQSAGRGFYFGTYEDSLSVLEGVTVRNGTATYGGGICCENSASPVIRNCVLEDNAATSVGGGGLCCNSTLSDVTLDHCTFSGNSSTFHGGAVLSMNGSLSVSNCTFYGNSAPTGGGLALWAGVTATVDHSIISFGTQGSAADCSMGGAAAFSCCDVYGNAGGNWVGCITGQGGTNGNLSADPLFCDAQNGDLRLSLGSPCAEPQVPPGCHRIGSQTVGCFTVVMEEAAAGMSQELALLPNVPNPFNPITEISYVLPGAGTSDVSLTVYNSLGQRVRTLVDRMESAGTHSVLWDGTGEEGSRVASGVYFAYLRWRGEGRTQRMVLLK